MSAPVHQVGGPLCCDHCRTELELVCANGCHDPSKPKFVQRPRAPRSDEKPQRTRGRKRSTYLKDPEARAVRAAEIHRLRAAGETWGAIGELFGLTDEGARFIAKTTRVEVLP